MRYFVFSFLLFLISCKDELNTINDSGCDFDLSNRTFPTCETMDFGCTEEYRTIVIQVVDQNNQPVQFDKHQVINQTTGEEININWLGLIGTGYIIAEDAMLSDLPVEGHCIELQGIINDKVIVRQSYLVGHDCCHVVLWEGPQTITL